MTARQQFAYNFFVEKGYAPLGAAAIVGNGVGESGPNLDSRVERGARADHGSGGFLEWRLERKDNLYKFAKSHRADPNDL
ncbi:MAG: phage tail tip lysozyme, partial [Nitrososphaera sp.]|nr:phage tail tip lysozyme [Nitrososphaera sp.]